MEFGIKRIDEALRCRFRHSKRLHDCQPKPILKGTLSFDRKRRRGRACETQLRFMARVGFGLSMEQVTDDCGYNGEPRNTPFGGLIPELAG